MLNTHCECQRRSRARLSTPWMLFNIVWTDYRSKCLHLNGALLTGNSGAGGMLKAFLEMGSTQGRARVPEVGQTLRAGCLEVNYD